MKTLMMGTAAVILAAGTAFADDVLVFPEGEEAMTLEQYHATLAEPRDDYWADVWFPDRDPATRQAFNESWFAQYDMDGDNILTQDEVRTWNEDNLRLNAMRSGREFSGQ